MLFTLSDGIGRSNATVRLTHDCAPADPAVAVYVWNTVQWLPSASWRADASRAFRERALEIDPAELREQAQAVEEKLGELLAAVQRAMQGQSSNATETFTAQQAKETRLASYADRAAQGETPPGNRIQPDTLSWREALTCPHRYWRCRASVPKVAVHRAPAR